MEIKCKVSFAIPEELMKALDITDDTPVIASISDGRITVEIVDEDELYDENFCEDDLCDEDCDCEDGCEYCEYYCTHCQKCVLDE
jgi:hypothetical protein